ncbi:MAG TPA: hypothetical protein PKJ56_06185 [Promineifilum sp.]|nr:hypothetical protein [Promineifilum sp.]
MRISDEAIIPREKLLDYLLKPRRENDKSRFLARVGFTRENPDELERAIRQLVAENDAFLDRQNEFGLFYRVEGVLRGPTGARLIVTIWLQKTIDEHYRFITLKPAG